MTRVSEAWGYLSGTYKRAAITGAIEIWRAQLPCPELLGPPDFDIDISSRYISHIDLRFKRVVWFHNKFPHWRKVDLWANDEFIGRFFLQNAPDHRYY